MKTLAALVFFGALAATAHATPIPGPRPVASFYTPDDGASHAIVATTAGDVWEAYWWEGTTGTTPRTVLHNFGANSVVAVSGYYSPDGYRHAIVALSTGEVDDVRYNPCCGIGVNYFTNLSGWGGANNGIKSISVWLDSQQRINMAFLTHWGTSDVLAIYQKNGAAETSTFIGFYASDSAIDVAGHHEVWNGTNMVTVAVGSPTHLEQIYWNDGHTPNDYYTVQSGSNVPWATRFPGTGQAAQTVVSLSASDAFCYFCSEFGPVEQMPIIRSTGAVENYATNNGGSVLWTDYPGSTMRAVSGPFTSPATGGNYRRNTIVSQTTGYVWNMTALWATGAATWTWRNLGLY